jgi:antitoxin component of MazEF toxin-antitoxin module
MPLVKPITKHGNSAGIIIDQALLKVLGWDVGTEVELQVRGHSIVLSRHSVAAQVAPSLTDSSDK